MPVFAGARYQKGHGLGSILSGVFRRVLPFLKANGKNFAVNLLRTGVDVADDVFDGGKKFTESLKERVPQGIKRTVQDLKFQSASVSKHETYSARMAFVHEQSCESELDLHRRV